MNRRPKRSANDLVAQTQAAVRSIRREARGLEPQVVESMLRQALREGGGFLSASQIAVVAKLVAQPRWSFVHPFKARSLARSMESSRSDFDARTFERECALLRHKLADSANVVSVESTRTVDGAVHVVGLLRFTLEECAVIERRAAPIPVQVVESR